MDPLGGMAVHSIQARHGATVRQCADLTSPIIAQLPRNACVEAYEPRETRLVGATLRLRIRLPVSGWLSQKVLRERATTTSEAECGAITAHTGALGDSHENRQPASRVGSSETGDADIVDAARAGSYAWFVERRTSDRGLNTGFVERRTSDRGLDVSIKRAVGEVSKAMQSVNLAELAQDIRKSLGRSNAVDEGFVKQELLRYLVTQQIVKLNHEGGRSATERGEDPRAYSLPSLRAGLLPRDVLRLRRGEPIVMDGLLSDELTGQLRRELDALDDSGCGQLQVTIQKALGTRDDRIKWMAESDAVASCAPAVGRAISLLKGVAARLNDEIPGWNLTVPRRAMLACYPGREARGARYRRHRDNARKPARENGGEPERGNWREVTAIVYANADWTAECGGCLRVHTSSLAHRGDALSGPPDVVPVNDAVGAGADAGEYVDVEPRGGRVVLFMSELVHEVLPAYSDRMAVTLWILREDKDQD